MCNVKILLQVICLSFVVVRTVESFSFSLSNVTRVRRQAGRENCPKPNFPCKSGECIKADLECDGAVDCQDASDESNSCQRIKCPSYLFTCKYGACINKNLECDGKPDCRDGSDENTPKCNVTEDASPQCTDAQFRCSSGQCIDQDQKCDGVPDCQDKSDEIKATCWNVKCPGYTYKCDYGACVNGRAECNGVVECFDGSDEKPSVCKTTVPVTPAPIDTRLPGDKTSCILPNHPNFGSWSIQIGGGSSAPIPGNPVRTGSIITVECKKNYKLYGNNTLFCRNGNWSTEMPECLKACPPILSTETMQVTCIYKHQETENCTEAVDGTLAKFKCAPFYEDLSLTKTPVRICQGGDWDQTKPKCVPVCGQKTVESTPLIINGTNVTKGDYPWQVALYNVKNKLLICGGSLLNQRVVLTAAHCISDQQTGRVHSKENYIVAVGKYFRPYDDSRDRTEAQFSELAEMFVPDEYKGNKQNFLGDIAILVTRKVFTLSRRVQPVCLDIGLNYNVAPNGNGYVTGWGLTKEGSNPSEILKELKVPSVSLEDCRNNLPEDYDIYLTHDKLCAGYLEQGASVCKGDSGGALVFKHDGRYYVTGVVSLSPRSPVVDGCDSQRYGLYTRVSNYVNNFIYPKLANYKT